MTAKPKSAGYISLAATANLMARVGMLEETVTGKPKDEEYFNQVAVAARGIFRVVVMGEIKKGKSSFINALCGMEGLVPVHSDVATSTVFKIHYGEEHDYKVFFLPEANKGPLPIGHAEVDDYGTENGNPDNKKQVDFIAVQAPAPLLKSGLILVDTPGVGGLFKKHRDITYRHAPKADAVFFVTESNNAPIGNDEISFLKDLRKITPLVYFVQTKASAVDASARLARMENNLSILADKVEIPKAEIRYFTIDSKLKQKADANKNLKYLKASGFQPLQAYINTVLKPARERNVAVMGIRRAASKLAQLQSEVEGRKLILDASTAEQQQELRTKLQEAQEAITEWHENIRPGLVKEFHLAVQEINSDLTGKVTRELSPGGRISERMHSFLNQQTQSANPEDIYALVGPIVQETRAEASETMLTISNELKDRFSRLVEALAIKSGASLPNTSLLVLSDTEVRTTVEFSDASLLEIAAKASEDHFFERTRTGLYGGMAGGTIAMIAGGVIGSVIPVVGTIVGSTVGMMIAAAWGGHQALEMTRIQQSSAARQQVLAAIDKDLARIHAQTLSGLHKAFGSLRIHAEGILADMVKEAMRKLSSQRAELEQRSKASSSEIQTKRHELKSLTATVEALGRELKAAEKSLA
jgi:hypothetical protein